jgi:hypothetical protein
MQGSPGFSARPPGQPLFDYYRRNLADAALMVFPDPAGVHVKDEILSSVSGQSRWSGAPPWRAETLAARASSACVHDGRAWELAFHHLQRPSEYCRYASTRR